MTLNKLLFGLSVNALNLIL